MASLSDVIEARIIVSELPGSGPIGPLRRGITLQRTPTEWRLVAPLDTQIIPVLRWLAEEPLLRELEPGTRIVVEPREDASLALGLRAPRGSAERLIAWLRPVAREHRIRRTSAGVADVPSLTPSQDDALTRAVALGYYHVPRGIHLSQLAVKLGVSPAALSERLRRAETRLVTQRAAHVGGGPREE